MKNQKIKLMVCMLIVCNLSAFAQNKVVFNYTGSDQFYTVPAGVAYITVKAWAAGGAGGNYVFNDYGGGGGYATGVLNVTPGEVLKIIVGEGGKMGIGPGAYGGGGAKSGGYASYGGRGGGRSAIRNSSGVELLTAGAGGGGGGSDKSNHAGAGGGGGYVGGYGNFGAFDGQPGTQTAGGIGGHHSGGCTCGSHPGSQFQGGEATAIDNGYNGSGGGGYYGGGSGTDYGDGGGGGGSSYVPAGGCTLGATNYRAANNTDNDHKNLAGRGGTKGEDGKNGRVVILPYGFCAKGTPVPISANGACDGSISFDTLGGTPPYTFLWSDGYTSGSRNNICPGTYYITISDAIGCSKTVKRIWFDPTGIPGAALNFNHNYINCKNSAILQINNQITVEAWVKPAPGAHRIMGKYDNNLASGWRLYQDGSHFIFGVSSGTDHDLVSSVSYNDNQWYHVAGTYNKNTGVLAIYVNGVVTLESNYYNGVLLNTTNRFWIGAFMAWGYNDFVGSLDEVRIWNTERTSNEISQYRNCELAGSESGLVAYYKFNQGIASGNNAGVTTLIDATSNGLNGTLINFALTGSTSNWLSPGAVSGNCVPRLTNHDVNSSITTALDIYPNPAKDLIKISLNADVDQAVDIKVYDQIGREVIAKNKVDIIDDFQLNVSSLPNGLYVISIINDGEKYSTRFIVNR